MATRRSFVRVAGSTSLAAWAAIGNLRIVLAAGTAEAPTLSTLTRIARLIYPHDGLSDAVYAGIVGTILDDQKNEAALRRGVANLHDYMQLADEALLNRLGAIDEGQFFDTLKVPLMWALYNTQELWDLIGYPGPSFPIGGYINHGFDDIDWLPA